jgi:ribose 5-phosphate isomerase B
MRSKLTSKPVALASDHRAVPLKGQVKAWLLADGYEVTDCGTHSDAERVDAMDFALHLVSEIKSGRADFAVGMCGSGQMMAITANRFPFIRAALLHTPEEAVRAREHGDANMLVLGADVTGATAAEAIVRTFLSTGALGDRYAARRARLAQLDPTKV